MPVVDSCLLQFFKPNFPPRLSTLRVNTCITPPFSPYKLQQLQKVNVAAGSVSSHPCTYVCIILSWCLNTAIISLFCLDWLVFVTETESVYCAVRTESLIRIHLGLWRDTMMFNLVYHQMRFEDGRQWQVTCYTLLQGATRLHQHLPRTISTKGGRVDTFQPNFKPGYFRIQVS